MQQNNSTQIKTKKIQTVPKIDEILCPRFINHNKITELVMILHG